MIIIIINFDPKWYTELFKNQLKKKYLFDFIRTILWWNRGSVSIQSFSDHLIFLADSSSIIVIPSFIILHLSGNEWINCLQGCTTQLPSKVWTHFMDISAITILKKVWTHFMDISAITILKKLDIHQKETREYYSIVIIGLHFQTCNIPSRIFQC